MTCPECNSQCYRDGSGTFADSWNSCWRCENCGWYEGWEVDRQIEADLEKMNEKEDL